MKIKSNILMFVLLTVFSVFLCGAVSAILDLKAINVPTSVSHNQGTIPITFTLSNNGVTQTELKWTGSSNIGDWNNLASLPSTINAGAQIPITAVLTIPRYQSGNINANIKVESKEGESNDESISLPIAKSASLSIGKNQELTLDQNGKISITNTGNVLLSNIELSASGNVPVTFSSSNPLTLAPGASLSDINVIGSNINSSLKFGNNIITISAKDLNENIASNSVTFSILNGFCKSGQKGDLAIRNFNLDSSGSDQNVWKPLDEITIDVEVENNGNTRINNVYAEIGLFDSAGKNFIKDADFTNSENEKIKIGGLSDGNRDTATFTFRIPADFNEKGTFKLAVKTYSKDSGESEQCADRSSDLSDDLFESIDIEREDSKGKFIAFDNIKVNPEEVVCGDSVRISTDAFNVGSDQEDQVKVNLVNSKLNVDLSREIKDNLNEGDKKNVLFEFVIPTSATDGTYTLDLSSDYDYRRGTYRQSSDDTTPVTLKVFGCKALNNAVQNNKVVSIAASLDSEAVAGKDLAVKTTITNIGANESDFVVTASGFENWAQLSEISDRLIHLKSGESKIVNVNMKVNPDAEGEKSFSLEVRSGGKLETREIAVNIQKSQTSPGLGINIGGNGLIWVIGIINIVLIVFIIIVAARISRK